MQHYNTNTDNLNTYHRYRSFSIYVTRIEHQRRNITTILKLLVSTLPAELTRSTMIYSHIYPSAYEVIVQMILPEHVLVHIRDENNDQVR